MRKPKVLCLTYPKFAGEEYLKDFKTLCDVDVISATDRSGAITEIASRAKSSGPFLAFCVFMGTRPYEDFDAALLAPLVPHCRLIVSASAGYNEFDVPWMTANSILFCNSRHAVSEPTADMTMFLILAVLRDTSRAEKSARTGLWRNDHIPTADPRGLVLGIVGMGAIGQIVAQRAGAFGMRIRYHNRMRLEKGIEDQLNAIYCSSLEELLTTADVISIHCPLNESTLGLISEKEFSVMKDGVFFINTARGPIVDEKALIAALGSGKVRRAGLDVFEDEPGINPYFASSDKCTIQPHLGGGTRNAWMDGERECFENIKSYVKTGKPIASVNSM
ncbi:glycerate-and formate-dehydrogenase [Bisporella sp. PMI_857]|nr:glycerate-and formate-dehydrogenase [Bisporella sp. PMI_857]